MDDNAIIELFFARSEQAIRELDKKYGKVCHSLAYNILHNRLPPTPEMEKWGSL